MKEKKKIYDKKYILIGTASKFYKNVKDNKCYLTLTDDNNYEIINTLNGNKVIDILTFDRYLRLFFKNNFFILEGINKDGYIDIEMIDDKTIKLYTPNSVLKRTKL